jgi:hypothetical protein
MKTTLLSVLTVIFVFSLGALPASDITEVYNAIVRMSQRNTPTSYRVKVQNKSFEEALADLPEEILTGTGEPVVAIHFKKGEGVRIVIENIKSEYESLFSMYEDYLEFSGISNVQNPPELKEIIDRDKVVVHREDENTVVLKAWDPEKVERGDDFALFTLSRDTWVIEEAVYYLDGNPYVRAENKYKRFGSYYLPYEIVLRNLSDESSEVFLFTEYRFE